MAEEERYKLVFLNGIDGSCSIQDNRAEIPTFYNDLSPYFGAVEALCDLLNEKEERIQKLEKVLLDTVSRTEANLGKDIYSINLVIDKDMYYTIRSILNDRKKDY